MKMGKTICLLVALFGINAANSETVYSNHFDSLDGIFTSTGTFGGSVSLESGQLKLSGVEFNFRGAYASIEHTLYSLPYTGTLGDIQGTISWSFNLSNMDASEGGINNDFEVHLVSSNLSPDDSTQYSYALMGGGFVGNRMMLARTTHTNSPYGNEFAILVEVPSAEGLEPLPEKGSFRIDFTPSTGHWDLYAEYGADYVDPKSLSNLLGSAIDDTYIYDYLPYFTVESSNSGALFFDNLSVEITPIQPPVTTVFIDVRPDSDINNINLKSSGVVPVAVFGTDTFDVNTIDLESIDLSGAKVVTVGNNNKMLYYFDDINGDLSTDLVIKAEISDLDLEVEDGSATVILGAETYDGELLRGEDVVRIVAR